MLVAKHLDQQAQRKPIAARLLNQLVAWAQLGQRLGASAPILIQQTPGGPCLSWGGPISEVKIAKAPSGIPGRQGDTPGSADDVAIYYRDKRTGQLTPTGETGTVYNLSTTAVGTGYIKTGMTDGDRWVIWEDCQTSSSGG